MAAWRPLVKLTIAGEAKFMGPGVRELLQQIARCGSVRLASEAMAMSYSKAWRMLNTLEAEAGYPVLSRRQGGRRGGESTLTPEGERLLRRYEAYERACTQAVRAIFQEHFAKEAVE